MLEIVFPHELEWIVDVDLWEMALLNTHFRRPSPLSIYIKNQQKMVKLYQSFPEKSTDWPS